MLVKMLIQINNNVLFISELHMTGPLRGDFIDNRWIPLKKGLYNAKVKQHYMPVAISLSSF